MVEFEDTIDVDNAPPGCSEVCRNPVALQRAPVVPAHSGVEHFWVSDGHALKGYRCSVRKVREQPLDRTRRQSVACERVLELVLVLRPLAFLVGGRRRV